jgi:hypothetical protein
MEFSGQQIRTLAFAENGQRGRQAEDWIHTTQLPGF